MSYDFVIRNGTVVDGSGGEPFAADVAIQDGRIATVGRVTERGKQELDAEGHVVTPGFIDGHTHMDAQIFWDPLGSCSCWHGVTTVVMGNCGFTLAPASKEKRLLAVRSLERAEDISRAAMDAGIDWTWETFPEYLDVIDQLPKGINYAANIGHSTLRTWAMGERAFEQEANDDDLRLMKGQLRAALDAGAIGFTTSRATAHETMDGKPVASRLASWDELRSLARVMGEAGGGVLETTQDSDARSPDPQLRRLAQQRLESLALDCGVAVTCGAFPFRGMRDVWTAQLDGCESVSAAGGKMFMQTHSRGINVILSFRTQLPFDKLPLWRDLRALPLEQQRVKLMDLPYRQQLVQAAEEGHYGHAVGGEARKPDWDRLYVYDKPLPPFRSVADIAASLNVSPVEVMIRVGLETDFGALFMQSMHIYDEADMVDIMRHRRSVMTFSDSGAHVSQIMDSSIQSYLLAYWVRERQKFTLPEAVRMITQMPAEAWGFTDRGLVRTGMMADLNVFDAQRLMPDLPKVAYDLPAGGKRLVSRSQGILATLVAGEIVHHEGHHTGALPGQLLRSRR